MNATQKDAKYILDLAYKCREEGNHMKAAETALGAQRIASLARGKKAPDIAFEAHCLSALEAGKAVTHAEKSRAGQIKKASLSIGWEAKA